MTFHTTSNWNCVVNAARSKSGLRTGHAKSPVLLTTLGMFFGMSLFALLYMYAVRRLRSSHHPQQAQGENGIKLTMDHAQQSAVVAEQDGLPAILVKREMQLNNLRAQLDSAGAQHNDLSVRLAECDKDVGDLKAQLLAVIGERDDLSLKLQDALTQTPTSPTRSDNVEVDDLLAITGIGPVYAAKLRTAGYRKFVDVAQATVEALADAIQAPAWRTPSYEEWITHAKQLAGIA